MDQTILVILSVFFGIAIGIAIERITVPKLNRKVEYLGNEIAHARHTLGCSIKESNLAAAEKLVKYVHKRLNNVML